MFWNEKGLVSGVNFGFSMQKQLFLTVFRVFFDRWFQIVSGRHRGYMVPNMGKAICDCVTLAEYGCRFAVSVVFGMIFA